MLVFKEPHPMENPRLPICAKCGKPVDRVVRREDSHTDALTFTAYCHGAKDRTIITGKEVVEWGPECLLVPDIAFRKDALRVDVTC